MTDSSLTSASPSLDLLIAGTHTAYELEPFHHRNDQNEHRSRGIERAEDHTAGSDDIDPNADKRGDDDERHDDRYENFQRFTGAARLAATRGTTGHGNWGKGNERSNDTFVFKK